jgi:uridine kinase
MKNDFSYLFEVIEKEIQKGKSIIAIEGGSASGKTTLSNMINEKYEATVFHMDDFFLQPFQRTKERYNEVGGNVDRERFLKEVLLPLSKGEKVNYRPFNCSVMGLGDYIEVVPQKLVIIEGAYSMHPDLRGFYGYSVFLDIDEKLQRERILKRNTPVLAQRFFDEWIPLEKRYFNEMRIKEKCDLIIKID